MKTLLNLAAASLLIITGTDLLAKDYEWKDEPGKYRDLYYGNRALVRYVYEQIDQSNPARRDETLKPFHHVYAFNDGKTFITKGHGGKYTHHRGIFYGFANVSYVDGEGKAHKNVDTWHCRKAHQVHEEFLSQRALDDKAILSTRIAWIGDDGKAFASEERTLTFALESKDLVIDFRSTLTSLVPNLRLDGDPQHAGFQFRASNNVAETNANMTFYIRPTTGQGKPGNTINWSSKTDSSATRDLPWKAMSFILSEKNRYTVAYLDKRSNPKPARYSERDYGRFGSYFYHDMTPAKPLRVDYRLRIRKGEMSRDEVAAFHKDYTTGKGKDKPTPKSDKKGKGKPTPKSDKKGKAEKAK